MHPLEKFKYCPVCGSRHFEVNDDKSKKCDNCGFEYYLNPSAANVALILNEKNELLVLTRKIDPGKGTLDLPGGFANIGETAEQGVIREVKEETTLEVSRVEYLFSFPNVYQYGGFEVKTLDSFFLCHVSDTSHVEAHDDAAEYHWIALEDIHTELFGLRSIRHGLTEFIASQQK
ncbi:hydrolase, NUDIX family [Hallella bergensis DSM 17361]|uniref:Hydrolase, NUDIX family n=1 Tax=Hallella bergensis DSM 17361 TaxID=585502 RepID=D1PTU9_9BACT|nr:NUDIX domain-containing protein [Hallella bergensis]EFA45157.1 hydrolase, NUDIX family [Hallella bergensis DSM 17361]